MFLVMFDLGAKLMKRGSLLGFGEGQKGVERSREKQRWKEDVSQPYQACIRQESAIGLMGLALAAVVRCRDGKSPATTAERMDEVATENFSRRAHASRWLEERRRSSPGLGLAQPPRSWLRPMDEARTEGWLTWPEEERGETSEGEGEWKRLASGAHRNGRDSDCRLGKP